MSARRDLAKKAQMFYGSEGRRLVVVDIENLIGGAVSSKEASAWVKNKLTYALDLVASDQIVIGTSRNGMLHAGLGWPNTRRVMRSGVDGADLALLEVLDENLHERFSEVVIASGDHIFIDSIAELQSHGVHVTVVGARKCMSRRLVMISNRTIYLESQYNDLHTNEMEAA